jgi:predicted site-specific integrase-resolvase
MSNNKYIGGKEASKILGVHQRTLYQWDEKGWIETIRTNGGKRLYNVEKYVEDKRCKTGEDCENTLKEIDKLKGKLKISYVRVSTNGQKDDLERQKSQMRKLYPEHLMVEDIGSGLNLNKRGIRKIIDLAIEGRIDELVIAYKDRLTRFGYELIDDLIKKYSKGKIIILNNNEQKSPEEELVYDILQIMNVFTAKMNGLRKYKKKEEKENL